MPLRRNVLTAKPSGSLCASPNRRYRVMASMPFIHTRYRAIRSFCEFDLRSDASLHAVREGAHHAVVT